MFEKLFKVFRYKQTLILIFLRINILHWKWKRGILPFIMTSWGEISWLATLLFQADTRRWDSLKHTSVTVVYFSQTVWPTLEVTSMAYRYVNKINKIVLHLSCEAVAVKVTRSMRLFTHFLWSPSEPGQDLYNFRPSPPNKNGKGQEKFDDRRSQRMSHHFLPLRSSNLKGFFEG